MEITEVRVKLTEGAAERLRAFCSVTLDDQFVIRDLKIIRGAKGMFVAMPSRKLTDRCPRCRCKNHLRARFCNQCGGPLGEDRAGPDAGRSKYHADIAHPINADCRAELEQRVLAQFEREQERASRPGYVPVELHGPPEYDSYDY